MLSSIATMKKDCKICLCSNYTFEEFQMQYTLIMLS